MIKSHLLYLAELTALLENLEVVMIPENLKISYSLGYFCILASCVNPSIILDGYILHWIIIVLPLLGLYSTLKLSYVHIKSQL